MENTTTQTEQTISTPAVENTTVADIAVEQEYFFPTYGITLKATSIEEAEKKLKAIINKK